MSRNWVILGLLFFQISSATEVLVEENVKNADHEMFTLVAWTTNLISTYKMWEVMCVEEFPDKKHEYNEIFENENFRKMEKMLEIFEIDPKSNWDMRKSDPRLGPYEPPKLEDCNQLMEGVKGFVLSMDSYTGEMKTRHEKMLAYVDKLKAMEKKELEKYLETIVDIKSQTK